MFPSPRALLSDLVSACLAVALLAVPACTGHHTTQGEFAIPEDAYYREIKGWVAALEWAYNERRPADCRSNARQVRQVLSNSVEEDVTGYEDAIAQMDELVGQLQEIFDSGEGPEKAEPLMAKLVTISETLPGPTMAWNSYWEGPSDASTSQ